MPKDAPFQPTSFSRIDVRVDDKCAVPTAFTRLSAAGKQRVGVGQPDTAKAKPDLVQGLPRDQSDQPCIAWKAVHRRRVSGNGVGRPASDLITRGTGQFRARRETRKHRREQGHSRKTIASSHWREAGC
jgi:hypothetical protein